VTGNDLVVIAYQHGIGKPKCLDAVGDLPDLLLGMGTGVLAKTNRETICGNREFFGPNREI
jgi:hypothetical protein